MITINNQKYEFLGNNLFRNVNNNQVVDGASFRGRNINIDMGSNNYLDGVNIGNTNTVTTLNFGLSPSRRYYLKNLFPKVKKEIEASIPIKDKLQVIRCVTKHASCNYKCKGKYVFYRIFKGRSDWQSARKALLAEMDKNAAHHFLKASVGKYKAAKASC